MANIEKFHNTVLKSDIVKLTNQIDQANSEGQLEPLVMPKIADLKEALTIALSLWKIAHSPIGVTQDAMVEYKRRIDKLTEIVYPK